MLDLGKDGQGLFELFCGRKLGEGAFRTVYACNVRPDDWVVKFEKPCGNFSNVAEWELWCASEKNPWLRRWLAPVDWISDCGRWLIMRKADCSPDAVARLYPKKVPRLLHCDANMKNFGVVDGRLVFVDYGNSDLGLALKKGARDLIPTKRF